MKFGDVLVADAMGAVLAHSISVSGRKLAKGTVLTDADVMRLQDAGLAQVTVAQLEPGDVSEDRAAARLAASLVPDPGVAHLAVSKAFTGRVNLNAIGPGVAYVDADAITALNQIDPMITLATLPPLTRVGARTLVGTVKIISYAVSEAALQRACDVARSAIAVHPVTRKGATLVLTQVPGMKPGLVTKGQDAVTARLTALGISLDDVLVVDHTIADLASALQDVDSEMVLILTGSATSDTYDVGPEAVRMAGGEVSRFGMPVDPGNLLFLGDVGGTPVVGLPGCARSPALNGADWVLERIACNVPVGSADIARMGVGGLLKEIPLRPQPREPKRS
jgi:molybdenum cofactor cytidylyltransferase